MVYDQYGARQEIVENFPQRFAEAYLLEWWTSSTASRRTASPS